MAAVSFVGDSVSLSVTVGSGDRDAFVRTADLECVGIKLSGHNLLLHVDAAGRAFDISVTLAAAPQI